MVEVLKIGTAQAARGEIGTGVIRGVELSNGMWVDIPVILVNGMEDGTTLLITSTEHGTEIQGIEVIRQITRQCVDPKTLKGAIIALPVANPLAYMHHLYTSWIDNLDVYSVEAESREDAPTTVLLANSIWENAYKNANIGINIHTNTLPDSLIFQFINVSQPETHPIIEKMANAFGVTSIYEGKEGKLLPEDAPSSLANLAQRHGIPVLMIELIDGGRISEPSTTAGVRGILNIMKAFDMISGDIEPQSGFPIVKGECKYHNMVRCTRGGIIHPLKTPGEFIKKGEVIARTYNILGEEVEAPVMPIDGYIWAYPPGNQLGTSGGLQTVSSGDDVAYIFIQNE